MPQTSSIAGEPSKDARCRRRNRPSPHPSSAEKSPAETRVPAADETDASPEKIDTHRRNRVQLTTNANGKCERVVQTIKYEALLKFIIFGKRHLDYLVAEFVDYYNHRRSHMERDHLPPIREEPDEVETLKIDQIEVKSYVGGLIKSFERKAA